MHGTLREILQDGRRLIVGLMMKHCLVPLYTLSYPCQCPPFFVCRYSCFATPYVFVHRQATLLGSPRKWKRYDQSGMEFSDLLPHLGSCADELLKVKSLHSDEFNHHPGQLLMQCGASRFGMPTMGSWLSEAENLPG